MNNNLVEMLVKNLEEMMYSDYHIHAGIEREVTANVWKKNGNDRTYLNIECYSLAGNKKGTYKCGYINNLTGEYVTGRYDDVDALNKKYIGR